MNKIPAASFARPLRAVAILIAAASALWEGVDRLLGNPAEHDEIIVRLSASAVALAVAAGSSNRRSIQALEGLTFTLAFTSAAAECVILAVSSTEAWLSFAILTSIVVGTALFIPWSWRWQAALAGLIEVTVVLTTTFARPANGFSGLDIGYALVVLTTAAIASVLGAATGERERRRLAESESRYRGLFESAGDAIALLDDGGVIREANNALSLLLGQPVADLVGRRLAEFYAAPSPHDAGRQTLRRADGGTVEIDLSLSSAGAGATTLTQAMLRDVTERHAAERRQIQEQRLDALARFAGGIAHQFNNILGGILTHAGILREDAANRANAGELDEILDAARRGRALTQELLRFTRHEIITLVPTPAGPLLDSVAALARAALPKDAVVNISIAAGTPPLAGDADHLVSAFLQLVFNARDAMAGRPDNRLTLSAVLQEIPPGGDPRWPGATPGRHVRLTVSDNGPGMDAATLEHAFEPFFTTKPMHQAAGLGLAAVYSVVRDHKGTARVESVPGRGTTVHLLIPVAEPAPAAAAPQPATAPVAKAGAVVLVVDDEAIVRNSLKRALTRFGYSVLEAGDGGAALAQLQAANPPVDLVILDLVLPGGGAGVFELLKAVRPDLRVLVSSGYSPDADNAKALAARVQGFLPKPYEIKELRDAVAKAISAPLPAPPHP